MEVLEEQKEATSGPSGCQVDSHYSRDLVGVLTFGSRVLEFSMHSLVEYSQSALFLAIKITASKDDNADDQKD